MKKLRELDSAVEKRINVLAGLFYRHGAHQDLIRFKNAVETAWSDDDLLERTLVQLKKHIDSIMLGNKSGYIFDLPKKEKVKKVRQVRFSGDSKHREDMGQFQAKEGR